MSKVTKNIIVLGDDHVGKTRYCTSRLGVARIEETSGNRMGMQVFDITPRGEERKGHVFLRDTGRGGIKSAYFIGVTDAVIIYKTNVDKAKYEAEVRAHCGDIPITFIKSKEVSKL